mmetsp:Transcript_14858/g.40733  ORF Transcript_14858/g.40733 Transcript_14858/m.40733 type:complete len:82 (+) Transcript_14858:55-300(+)
MWCKAFFDNEGGSGWQIELCWSGIFSFIGISITSGVLVGTMTIYRSIVPDYGNIHIRTGAEIIENAGANSVSYKLNSFVLF